MAIERLLTPEQQAVFLEQHYQKLPFSLPGGCRPFCDLGSWETIEGILAQENPDVLVVREGQRWSGTKAPSGEEARRLFEDGYTILVRHAERHDRQIAELAASFARDFAGPVDVHIYCTPGGQRGFGWHYDAEDVFILQTTGLKTYSLRKNTVNPWPLAETLPADMRYEREIMPLSRCTLSGGDWLYIPCGYWHVAEAQEDAISLAVGVLSPSALDLLDFLRQRLLDSLRWRQRLPCPGEASTASGEELLSQYQPLLEDLAADLARQLTDERLMQAFIQSRLDQSGASQSANQDAEPAS